jgi:hypothetical protein
MDRWSAERLLRPASYNLLDIDLYSRSVPWEKKVYSIFFKKIYTQARTSMLGGIAITYVTESPRRADGKPLSGGWASPGPYIGQRKWRDHTRPPKIKGPPNQYLVMKSN